MMQTDSAEYYLKRPGKETKWFAFINDSPAAEIFTLFAQHQHQESICLQPSELNLLPQWIQSGITPTFLFIEISNMDAPYTELQTLIEDLPINTNVIVLGTENDIGRYRQLQKMGINEYLFLPITEELLMQACLEPGMKRIDPNQKIKTLIPVIGVRGGSGATTVAINSAYNWSLFPNQRVCLLDLDTHASDIALHLDITGHDGVQEALAEIERIDYLFIDSLFVEKQPNLFVITNNWSIMHPCNDDLITDAALQHFLMMLYEKVDTIFVDLSFPLNKNMTNMLLPHSSCCLLITDLSLSATRDTVHTLQWIKMHAPDLDVKIIANITRPIQNLELIQQSMEKAIGKKLDLLLPYCKTGMQQSVLNGELFAQNFKKVPFTKKLRSFTEALIHEHKGFTAEHKSWLRRLREWL